MNKWKRRAREEKADRKRLQEDIRVLRRSAVVQHWQSKKLLDQVNALSEREATALNQVEEYRRQGNEAIREVTDQREGLLAWQRRAREKLPGADHVITSSPSRGGQNCVCFTVKDWDVLRRAIESDEPVGGEL
jgi:hypothetical protein